VTIRERRRFALGLMISFGVGLAIGVMAADRALERRSPGLRLELIPIPRIPPPELCERDEAET